MASNEYCIARQRTRKREEEFRSIYFIVGGKVWNMDRGTGMRLRKVCPQCSTVIHARRSICECDHAFTLKREARNTATGADLGGASGAVAPPSRILSGRVYSVRIRSGM